MGDFNFMRLFICALNGWDPYSEEVMKTPYFYWLIAFKVNRYKLFDKWKKLYKPQAEFQSSIQSPENYTQYRKIQDQTERNKKEGLPDQVKVGDSTIARADTYIDPEKGLVKMSTGEVLISKDELQKRMNIDGIAYSL